VDSYIEEFWCEWWYCENQGIVADMNIYGL
jgi:hypothetical protein